MELKLQRLVFGPTRTIGKLYVDEKYYGFTMEDRVRDVKEGCIWKVKNETAIPFGRYEIVINFSNCFQKKMPQIMNVPCFDGIRIHGGNTEKDTEGCILVGKQSDMKTEISGCHPLVEDLYDIIHNASEKEKVFITITK